MKYIIDRFEENMAVCEDENGSFVDIDINRLPAGCKEGSFILINEYGEISLFVDTEREKRIADKMAMIFKKSR